MYRFMQFFIILGAESLRYDNARAYRQTVAQPDQHIDDIAGAAHGGQCLFAHILTDHYGVHRIVQLLEQEPQRHGDSKFQKMPPYGAIRHVRIFFTKENKNRLASGNVPEIYSETLLIS